MPLSAACKLKRPSLALGSPAIKGRILANFSPAKTQIPRRCGELFLSLLCTILSLVSRNCIGTRGPCKLQFTRTKSNPQSDSESNEINRIAFFILRQDWETRPHTAPMPLVSHPFQRLLVSWRRLCFKPGRWGKEANKSSLSFPGLLKPTVSLVCFFRLQTAPPQTFPLLVFLRKEQELSI